MNSEVLKGLNEAQREAVTSTEGYIRVIAGAGTGKTRALSHRFAYLVLELGIMPSGILCVTFTNKSANEMRHRIRALTGDNDSGYISTFHGFCVSVLQEDSHAVSYPRSFLVLDNSDIDQMLRIIYEERGITLRDMTFSKARDMIEIRKGLTERDYCEYMIAMDTEDLKKKYDEAADIHDIIFYGYLYNEKKCFGLDYNDLIFYTLYIFSRNEEIRHKWQSRLEYIMVDEFQDIDEPQYELMRVLSGYHKNLFIVGDPDQTIYTWRGADVRFLLHFDEEFKGTKTIMMTQNYRSTPEILSCANSLIEKNRQRIDKVLLPTLAGGQRARYRHCRTEEEEAHFIADEARLLEASGTALSDMAVLYRAHYVTRTLEEVFQREELPYIIYSGVQFFDRAEIKDVLSYLRLIAYRDDLSFLRIANVPKRNLGEKRMRFLRNYAAENSCTLYDALKQSTDNEIFRGTKATRFLKMTERLSDGCFQRSVSELLSDVLRESGYEEALRTEGAQTRLDNLAELRQAVHEYEITCGEECVLESWLSHVALMTNTDIDGSESKLKLMTVHSAKGMEFPYVFIPGLNEGIFPSKRTSGVEGIEEERRLAFVAVTRAMRGLYISDSEGRNIDGSFRYPSRFIFNIDNACLDYDRELAESLVRDACEFIDVSESAVRTVEALPVFRAGDEVEHPVFGWGVVQGLDLEARAYLVMFSSLGTQRRISFRARLTGHN